MKRAVNASAPSQSKIDHIKSGGKVKSQVGGVKENKNVIQGKGGKFTITEKEKKFEEAGVARKKRNYVMYESKLGTEKEQEFQHVKEVKKQKPKPKVVPQPRNEEKIITQIKRVEYLDNYQYHETKDIKDNDPNKQSIVTHQRLGDIVGGTYEEKTFQRITMNDPGRGPKLYSQQTTKTTTRRNAAGQPTTTTQRSNSASRSVPAKSREQRNEMQKLASNPNLRGAPKKPAPAAPTRQPITTAPKKTTTTTTKTTSSRPPAAPATRTTTTTTRTTSSRSPAPKGPAAPGTKKTTTTTTTTTTKNTSSRSPAPKGPAAPGARNTTTTTTKKTTTTTRTTSSRSPDAKSPAGGATKKTTTTTRTTTSRSPAPKTQQVTVKKTTRTQSAERGRRH
jgi:hypothetical protein